MPTHTKHVFLHRQSAFWKAVNLILSVFQSDFPLWGSGQLIGLPTYQGLLEGVKQRGSETLKCEVLSTEAKPIHLEAGLLDEEPAMTEKKRSLPSVEEAGDLPDGLTVREMSERYRLASSHSRLLSKEAQN